MMTVHPTRKADILAAPLRQANFWHPELEIRRTDEGVFYVRQLGTLPEPPKRIADRLKYWARRTPDALFIADRGADGQWRKLTYAQMLERAERLGQFLVGMDLSPEHPVVILSGNDIEHAQLALACILVGVPHASLSEAYSLISTDYTKLKDIAATLEPGLVFAADGKRFAQAIDAAIPADTPLLAVRNPARSGTVLFSEALETGPGEAMRQAAARVAPDTIAKFLFTSGSTGSPKAVINTNRMICANQMMVRDCYAFMQDEPPIVLDWAPWSHTAGGNKVFFMVLFNGGTLYIDDGRPTPDGIRKTVRNLTEVAPTWYFNVPKGYEELVREFDADPALRDHFFSRVKMLMYAGAALAQYTWDELQRLSVEATGERVLIAAGLGATETSPFALMCTFEAERAGNVGVPSRGLELKLVPVGDKLEARLKGPSITPGFWKDPELTARSFDEEGFYSLGDALRFADPDDVTKGFYFDGRTAENFKLSSATWVNVGRLRGQFVDHFGPIVRDLAITGADRAYLGALVFPDMRECRQLAGDEALSGEALLQHPRVRAAFRDKLKALAANSTGSSTCIRRIILMVEPPDIDKGEATDKGSINQRAVLSARRDEVEALYAGDPRAIDIGDDS
jgi:feruloyl-CoA synthase